MKPTSKSLNLRIRLGFWILGSILGFLQAWAVRLDANDNTVSYLDMTRYFFQGHRQALINGFWSPLYAVLLGFPVHVMKPSIYWEYPTVHLVAFFIFLFAMACFDYFLRQSPQLRSESVREGADCSMLGAAWTTMGYSMFLWSSLQLTGVDTPSPDMLVAGLFYLSCGLLLNIWSGRAKWASFLLLGVVLGLSYLTKFGVLPISLLILVTASLLAKRKARYVAISTVAFVAIILPFIAALSAQKGRITTGEEVTYDYVIGVNRIADYHWQGDQSMPAKHPTRQIFQSPPTFEFKEPWKGTYPPQYDISYWYDGAVPQIHLGQEIHVLVKNLFWELRTAFFSLNGVLVTTLALLFYESGRRRFFIKDVLRFWFLVVPSVATAVLYAVFYYNPKLLAAPFVVLFLCLFSIAAFPAALPKSRWLPAVAALQFAMFCILVCFPVLLHAFEYRHQTRIAEQTSYQAVAKGALAMGLRPDDCIASLDASNGGTAMWAHLARAQIVAEVFYRPSRHDPATSDFWDADPETQQQIIERLSQTGARAVVSQDAPTGPSADRWLEIGASGYYLYWLKPQG
jgi:hypothetical protein